jgi:hypothetical protein
VINSHIVLPKFLLKNFEINHSFWYYDIDKDFVAKGNASSFNTDRANAYLLRKNSKSMLRFYQ